MVGAEAVASWMGSSAVLLTRAGYGVRFLVSNFNPELTPSFLALVTYSTPPSAHSPHVRMP